MAIIKKLSQNLEKEYFNLPLWYVVSFLSGIVWYFSKVQEVRFAIINSSLFIVSIALIVIVYCNCKLIYRFLVIIIVFFIIGVLVAKFRVATIEIDNDLVEYNAINNVEGTINSIRPTITGSQIVVSLEKVNRRHAKTKNQNIRLNISEKYLNQISINDKIKVAAKLFKVRDSIMPGGYDFSFYAFFSQIIATGYVINKPVILRHNDKSNFETLIYNIRKFVFDKLIILLGKNNGNFAAAILLGETKGINKDVMNDMRQTGISHILCVSGLHLSLVAMIFFGSIRFILNLFDCIAFRVNIKLLAAMLALLISFFYLELSSKQIAATRAFIMTAIFIFSMMVGRSPSPLRSLSIAAFVILSANPEYIFHPSFQLSFIAVLSLIGGFEFFQTHQELLGNSKGIFASIKFYLISNIYSSFLASILTAPIVINQFYIFSTYSVLMNLIAVPIMSFFLMPLSILAVLLMPLKLDFILKQILNFFIDIIIHSAAYVNKLPGSIWYFGNISKSSLVVFLFGFFWIIIWKTKWRFYGLVIMLGSLFMMGITKQPDIIVDPTLRAIGIKNESKKIEIFAERIQGFTINYWANWFGQKGAKVFKPIDRIFTLSSGKKIALNYFANECSDVDVQINMVSSNCVGNEITLDVSSLKQPCLIYCDHKVCKVRIDRKRKF